MRGYKNEYQEWCSTLCRTCIALVRERKLNPIKMYETMQVIKAAAKKEPGFRFRHNTIEKLVDIVLFDYFSNKH